MTIRFVEEANRELLDAIAHYEGAQVNLGRRFKDEASRSIQRIADRPELHRLRPGAFRRVNLPIFPYYIPYVVRGDTLWILAVAHASRRPRYWISRRIQMR